MGCCSSTPKESVAAKDKEAISNFLEGTGTLDALWKQFDDDDSGTIDQGEFRNLVYHSLLHFCMQRNPDLPAPSRENMKPFIEKLCTQLQPFVDRDQDMQITRDEFKGYGTYLTTEFKKLKSELEDNQGKRDG